MTPNHEGPCPYCRKPMGEPHDEWCGYIRVVFNGPDPVVTTYNTLDAEVARLKTENERLHMDVEVVTASLDAAMDERDRLRKFCDRIGRAVWDLDEIDSCDFEDVAQDLGLMVEIPADYAARDLYDADTMFVWAWSPLAQEAKPS